MTPSGLTHGADTDRLEDIATQLLTSAQRVGAVGDTGTASAPVLEEAWAGGDCEAFIGSWQSARQMVEQTETHLRAFAALLLEQAAQQDSASGTGSASALHGASGRLEPRGGGGDDTAPGSPKALITGPSTLLERLWDSRIGESYRAQYRAWSASDLTYFERLFVPWAAPPECREKYLDFVDSKTDWANEQWVDKVSDWGPTDFVQGSLEGWSGALRDAQEFTKPLNSTGNYKILAINAGLENAAEELQVYSDIVEDPKGWWDGAGSVDQLGVVASAIPVGGVAAKGISKSVKEVIDLLSGAGKHVDDIPTTPARPGTPHAPDGVPPTTPDQAIDDLPPRSPDPDVSPPASHTPVDDLLSGADRSVDEIPNEVNAPRAPAVTIDDLTRAAEYPDPTDKYSRYQAEGSQTALKHLREAGVTDLARAWDDMSYQKRGLVFEATEGGNLPEKFPIIDRVAPGADGMLEVTSTKTLDPTLKSYGPKFESRINGYLRDVAAFDGERFGGVNVRRETVGTRTLELVVRPGSLSPSHHEALERIRDRAEVLGVKFVLKERP